MIERLERQATQITVLAGAVLNLARTVTAAVRSGEELPEGCMRPSATSTRG